MARGVTQREVWMTADEVRELDILVGLLRKALLDLGKSLGAFFGAKRKFDRGVGLTGNERDPEEIVQYLQRRAARPDVSYKYGDIGHGFNDVMARSAAITALTSYYQLRADRRIILAPAPASIPVQPIGVDE